MSAGSCLSLILPCLAVGLLLDHGADVDAADSRGWTALHVAATESEVTEGELRLLTMKTKEIDAVNHSGDTPLYLLVQYALNSKIFSPGFYIINSYGSSSRPNLLTRFPWSRFSRQEPIRSW